MLNDFERKRNVLYSVQHGSTLKTNVEPCVIVWRYTVGKTPGIYIINEMIQV